MVSRPKIIRLGISLRAVRSRAAGKTARDLLPALKTDRMLTLTNDWKVLHDRGGDVRRIYLIQGAALILATAVSG